MGNQVGHLPAKLMVKLAPYIDEGLVSLEGIIIGEKAVCVAFLNRLVLPKTGSHLPFCVGPCRVVLEHFDQQRWLTVANTVLRLPDSPSRLWPC